jgi:SNF2 family DNA or RNA helicase
MDADPTHGQYQSTPYMEQTSSSWTQQVGQGIRNAFSTGLNLLNTANYQLNNLVNAASDRYSLFAGGDLYDHQHSRDTKKQLEQLLENVRPEDGQERKETPHQMCVELREHQKIGLAWLINMEEGSNKGGILADDMGLGKTVQALALIVQRRSRDQAAASTLIIAPVALMRQWAREIRDKLKPRCQLNVLIHHGSNRKTDPAVFRKYDVVLTTYQTLTSEFKRKEAWYKKRQANPNAVQSKAEKFPLLDPDIEWYRVVLDEAQAIKNKGTHTSNAASQLRAQYRLCLTGTPMQNNIAELYPLIRFLRIAPYNRWEKFRSEILGKLRDDRKLAMDRIRALWKAIALRRLKTSMIDGKKIVELPPKIDQRVYAVFDEQQQELYHGLEHRLQVKFNAFLGRKQVLNNYLTVLVWLLRLRQACCHPYLIADLGVPASVETNPDDMRTLAHRFAPEVVERIVKERIEHEDSFECPVCMEPVANPLFAFPCGHDTCGDCFTRLVEPRPPTDDRGPPRCAQCRGPLNPKEVVDYINFCKVHAPAKAQELLEAAGEMFEDGEDDSDEDSDYDSSDLDDDDDPTLDGFIVPDSDIDEEEGRRVTKTEDDDDEGPQKVIHEDRKNNKKSKGKRKGKKKKETSQKPKVTLAQLKQMSLRNATFKLKYFRRLERRYKPSAKIDKAMEILRNIDETTKEKTIIFSQWTSFLDLLEIPIRRQGWTYRRYEGSMKADERDEAVEDFMTTPECKIFLISLKAGNAGLNLHAASQVIIMDPFWNPYVEMQAVDRAHRFPQEKTVVVHRIVIEGTVEDRILRLQDQKRETIETAMDESEVKNISRLSVQQLGYLFGLNNLAN